jgi:hypothetical protein
MVDRNTEELRVKSQYLKFPVYVASVTSVVKGKTSYNIVGK